MNKIKKLLIKVFNKDNKLTTSYGNKISENANTAAECYEAVTTLLSQSDNCDDTQVLLPESNDNSSNCETTLLNSVNEFSASYYLLDPLTGRSVKINNANFKIGSSSDNDFVICKIGVSHCHAVIVIENGDCYVIDQNSTNGTKVEGVHIEPMKKVKLEDGFIISFADEMFQFTIEEK